MKDRDTISSSSILAGLVALASAAALVALLAPVVFERAVDALRAERGWVSTPQATRDARAAQSARLAEYAWVDRAGGVVAVPIERAMQLVVDEAAAPKEGER